MLFSALVTVVFLKFFIKIVCFFRIEKINRDEEISKVKVKELKLESE